MPLKHTVAFFVLVAGALFGPVSQAEELSIHFKTTPRPELLRPFADPADLSVLVTGADGRPVIDGIVTARLDAPAPGLLFSTDYPLVEGTLLSELRLPLRQGKASWKYLFPIRGEYRLSIDAIANDGRKGSHTFSLLIREDQKKWLALGAFSAGLFVLGFVAGRIFTGTRPKGMTLAAAALFAATSVNPSPEHPSATNPAALKIEPARVGRPSEVRWSLARDGGGRAGEAALSLTITHLEKKKIVFAVDKVPVAGAWSMKFHFPDGAEYGVVTIGSLPGLVPLRSEEVIAVTGVEPAAGLMVRAVVYFIWLIVLGLVTGRWTKTKHPG